MSWTGSTETVNRSGLRFPQVTTCWLSLRPICERADSQPWTPAHRAKQEWLRFMEPRPPPA